MGQSANLILKYGHRVECLPSVQGIHDPVFSIDFDHNYGLTAAHWCA